MGSAQREGVHRGSDGGGATVGFGGVTVGGRFLAAWGLYSLNDVQGGGGEVRGG